VTDAKPIAGFRSRFADVKGCRMHYFVGGRSVGPPVVLVHGLGGAAGNWSEVAPLLARRHRVLVPDLPGHGRSSRLAAVPNLSVFADRVALVAEREELLPAVVVGHSLGGVVALRLALLRRDQTIALVLAAPAGISSANRRARLSLRLLGILRPRRLVAPWAHAVADSALLRSVVFGRWGAADPAAMPAGAVEGFLDGIALEIDATDAARALVRDDPREDLDELDARCLLLWGADDSQLPVGDAFDYARRLDAPLRVIADCGHLLIGERPDACLDAIEAFIASRRRSSRRTGRSPAG
jgi:pimeloyl-ACP methyl ester carboxylesterase